MDNGASSYRRFRDHGDESGLVEIIKEYRDGLIFYIYSIVSDLSAAEDLAEDVFVHLGTRKPRDNGKSSFKTWLYTIGRNRALNYLKHKNRHQTLPLEVCQELPDEEILETAFLRDARNQQLHKALQTLSPAYRQILWLIYFEGFSVKEAAAVMKKSVHSTETLVYRARKSLKSQLEKDGFMYEDL